jgi:hypothetical protein
VSQTIRRRSIGEERGHRSAAAEVPRGGIVGWLREHILASIFAEVVLRLPFQRGAADVSASCSPSASPSPRPASPSLAPYIAALIGDPCGATHRMLTPRWHISLIPISRKAQFNSRKAEFVGGLSLTSVPRLSKTLLLRGGPLAMQILRILQRAAHRPS